MDGFIKAAVCVFITLILYLTIEKHSKDMAVILLTLACILLAIIAVAYVQPIITYFTNLRCMQNIDAECISILLRCVGIGIAAEIISLICIDAGSAGLGKIMQITAGVAVLSTSMPLFSRLIELVEEILLFT